MTSPDPSDCRVMIAELLDQLRTTMKETEATATGPTRGVRTVASRFAKLVRAQVPLTAAVALPWTPPPKVVRRLRTLERSDRTPVARWEADLSRFGLLAEAAGLLRGVTRLHVRRDRRDSAADLRPEAWAKLGRLSLLEDHVWKVPPASADEREREEAYVVAAVIGTILFNDLTLPTLLDAVVPLSVRALQSDAACLTLAPRPPRGRSKSAHYERFAMDPRSLLLWGRVQRFRRKRGDGTRFLLPPNFRKRARLRGAVTGWLKRQGFNDWWEFARTVRIRAALRRGQLPVVYRAGRVVVGPAPAEDLRSLGWHVDDVAVPQPLEEFGSSLPRPPGSATMPRVRVERAKIRRVLRHLDDDPPAATRRAMADELDALRAAAEAAGGPPTNDTLLLLWASDLLRATGDYKSNTVRTWLAGVWDACDRLLVPDALATVQDREELQEIATALIFSVPAPGSQKVRRTKVSHLFRCLRAHGYPLPPLELSEPAFAIGPAPRGGPLLPASAIRAAVEQLRRRRPNGLALAAAAVVARYGGLRRIEVGRVPIDGVYRDRSRSIHVERSKTYAGRRWVPFGPLTPGWAMEIYLEYDEWRRGLSRADREWLVTEDGTAWDLDGMAGAVTRVLKQQTRPDVSFHSLRTAFITWIFVTWVAAMLGCSVPESAAEEVSCAEGVLAVLGRDPNDVLDRLAALAGHASPLITVSHYLRALDWFDAMTVRSVALTLSYGVVADLFQASDRWARKLLNEVRAPSVDIVLTAQVKLLASRSGD